MIPAETSTPGKNCPNCSRYINAIPCKFCGGGVPAEPRPGSGGEARPPAELRGAAVAPVAAPAVGPRGAQGTPKSELIGLGWFFLLASIAALVASLMMSTTVSAGSGGLYGGDGSQAEIHNLGLMARKLGFIMASGFAAVVSALIIVMGEIATARRVRQQAGTRG